MIECLNQHRLDAILVTDPYNIRHISGFSGGEGALFISQNRQVLLVDGRYTEQARQEAKEYEVREFTRNYLSCLAELIEEEQIKALGFEGTSTLYSDFIALKTKLDEKGVMLTDLGAELAKRRQIKMDWELLRMEKAQSIADASFDQLLGELRPGMTELFVAARLEYYMKEKGAQGLSFDTIVASGPNSSMPHAKVTDRELSTGDFVTMDFGCIYQGYCSDMTRTVVIGKASNKQKEVYDTVLQAQTLALDYISAGKRGCEVDKVARDYIEAQGYGAYFGHGLGHSVGLFIHEEPRLSRLCEDVLCENMIETVEPGIYIPKFGGVRIEDIVVVTKEGHRNLTHAPKELIEI